MTEVPDGIFPVIDIRATGRNIRRLRSEKGLSIKRMQEWFGFEEPRTIYKWQSGRGLPSIDNLYALSKLLDVPIEDILVQAVYILTVTRSKQSAKTDCRVVFHRLFYSDKENCFRTYQLSLPCEVKGLTELSP